MMNGAFIGEGGSAGLGPAAFGGGDLKISAYCGIEPDPKDPAAPPAGRIYGSLETLLSKEPGLEFAAINLPQGEAFSAALLALERGLHVICQPPFCLSPSQFETLRAASEKAQRIIFPVQPWEHAAPWQALSKAISRGLAGEITYAEVQAMLPGSAPAGGAAAALGWQAFSMLLAMVRRAPTAIEARLDQGAPAAFHTHFGGADGFIHLSCGAHAPRLRAAVCGDKGRLEMDGSLLRLDIKDLPCETVEMRHALVPGACHPEWLAAEVLAFKEEICGLRDRGSGLRNSRYCVKLLKNAPYSAAMKSAAVPL